MNRNLTAPERVVSFATNYIGLREIIGDIDNQFIVQMFADIGYRWVKDDETAWCSCFANWVSLKLGLCRSGKLDARSWLDVGAKIIWPEHGDVVVFWRESIGSWKGHVGFFMGYTSSGDVYCLGGNQNNEVGISVYPRKKVLGFRRLT